MQVLEYSITVFKYCVICIFLMSAFDLHKHFIIVASDTASAIAAFLHSLSGNAVKAFFEYSNLTEREMGLRIDAGLNSCLRKLPDQGKSSVQ